MHIVGRAGQSRSGYSRRRLRWSQEAASKGGTGSGSSAEIRHSHRQVNGQSDVAFARFAL